MKYFVVFILSVFSLTVAKADCSSNSLRVYPDKDTVATNSLFLVEGYALSQKIIAGLNTQFPIYLSANGKKITLLVKETLVGEFELTQALLRPEFPLEPGVIYTLVIDNLPVHEHIQRYDYATRKYKPVTFVASSFSDTISPIVTRNPVEIRKSFVPFGCGPMKQVVFDCPVADTSSLLVRTTVKDVASGKSSTYILTTHGKEIRVGHDMCSGEFHFDGGDKYEVTFVFMDICGNLSKPTYPVQITEPIPADGEGY